jgi:hypothetical protein
LFAERRLLLRLAVAPLSLCSSSIGLLLLLLPKLLLLGFGEHVGATFGATFTFVALIMIITAIVVCRCLLL